MSRKSRLVCFLSVLLIATLVLAVAGERKAGAADYPAKPITFVVHNNPGDALYIFADVAARTLNQKKIVPQPISVLPKVGGGSAAAYAYVSKMRKDPYTLLTCQPSALTTPIIQNLSITYKDFTPVACMVSDENAIAVKQNSKFKTINDLANQAKASPKSINMGGAIYGAADSIVIRMLEKETGARFNYVPFTGGGESMAALLGGHVDALACNPSEVMGQVQAGTIRILAVASETRSPYLPQTPNFKEEGINLTFSSFRGFVATGGVEESVLRYWENAFAKLRNDPEWKKMVEDNQYIDTYMDAKTFKTFLDAREELYKQVLSDMGLLKKK
jgi:putative tricarboxylic transport membrane protein